MTTETQAVTPEPQQKRNQWLMLQCRFCGYMMHCVIHRTVQNERTGQLYVKTRYNCPFCDFWQTLKIPHKIAETIVDREFLPPLA
jgi:hypothetical protein